MAAEKEIPEFYARSSAEWRAWLAENGRTAKAVRLIIYHKGSSTPGVTYIEAVEQALCYGWIDGKNNKRDPESSFQTFYPRSPKSNWSKSNRERVEKLTAAGLMTPAGKEMVDLAKRTGAWDALADAHNLIVPADLREALEANEAASRNFEAFSNSVKRVILEWILTAKRPETRRGRVERTAALAAENKTYFSGV